MSQSALFKTFHLKSLNLKNRFVMAPMTRTQSPAGIPTSQVTDYYARRAEGEVGLILSEGTVVNRPGSANHPDIPHFYGEALPQWKKVIEAVHRQQGQMGPQIWHVGKVPPQSPTTQLSAPQEGPDSMSVSDIEKTIQAFGEAAGSAKKLGFDCVELHGAHGYLIDQFFWSKTNNRTDTFGGKTIAERNRFAVEVIKAVRRAIGPELALIIRLSQFKLQDYQCKIASTPQEMEEWLIPLRDAGVDMFHCSQRRFWEPEFVDSDLNFAGWAKRITGCPTITVGSVGLSGDFFEAFGGKSSSPKDLSDLTQRLECGDFDLVAVGRAILQDPNWVMKIKDGRLAELETFTAGSFAKYY